VNYYREAVEAICRVLERRRRYPGTWTGPVSFVDALGVLRQFRSVRRQQVNRDIVESSDLGGEG
jgi:hypothetical protein